MAGSSIAVIGAGFSGALLTVHLLRRCQGEDRIYLVERNEAFGRGLAYATGNPAHLLNVRAENMSAFPDQPAHFREWLDAQPEEVRREVDSTSAAGTFVPRRLYGAYIQDLLGQAIWGQGSGRHLFVVNDEAVGLTPEAGGGFSLEVAGGRRYAVDGAVLALGNFPPDTSTKGYFGDPWDPAAVANLDRNATVLLIGTGLTMVDTVVSLLGQGHRGRIVAMSRRGLLPFAHRPREAWPPLEVPEDARASPRAMIQLLRREVGRAAAVGIGWQAVIDAVRPLTQTIWRTWSTEERRRFLRHARAFWDVHRHRIAPHVAEIIEAARKSGQLQTMRGRVASIDTVEDGLAVLYRTPSDSSTRTLLAARVINCSGPSSDYTRIQNPLIQSLLAQGLARPDPMRLGLEVSGHGALVDAEGHASERLFAVGPVTRGSFWEITAVPDIRYQCLDIACTLKPQPAVALSA
jgi:uncharacterized NAD(P)/FAD-binding protein YdhS